MEKHGCGRPKIGEDKRKRLNTQYSLLYSTESSFRFYKEAYENTTIWIDSKKEKFDELVAMRKEYEANFKEKWRLKTKYKKV